MKGRTICANLDTRIQDSLNENLLLSTIVSLEDLMLSKHPHLRSVSRSWTILYFSICQGTLSDVGDENS